MKEASLCIYNSMLRSSLIPRPPPSFLSLVEKQGSIASNKRSGKEARMLQDGMGFENKPSTYKFHSRISRVPLGAATVEVNSVSKRSNKFGCIRKVLCIAGSKLDHKGTVTCINIQSSHDLKENVSCGFG